MEYRERYTEHYSTVLGRMIYYDTVGNVVVDWTAGPFRSSIHRTKDYIKKTKDPLTGLTPPSAFDSYKWTLNPGSVSFTERIRGYPPVSFIRNWPTGGNDFYNSMPSPPGGWALMEGTDSELVAKLLAQTHPLRPDVSVPVMILDLAEAASLLKVATQNLLSLTGSSWLNYQFGWKQTIQDIRTLSNITHAIEQRIQLFNAILEKGGKRVKAHLTSTGKWWPPDEDTFLLVLFGKFFHGRSTWSFKSKVWGSVRWTPDRANTVELEKLTAFNQAARVVLDLDMPSPSTVWEGIPFSWLVDYFVNIGDTLQALEGQDLLVPRDICLMRRRTLDITYTSTVVPESDEVYARTTNIKVPHIVMEQKLRTLHNAEDVSDLLSFRILSERQLLNAIALLASLNRFK